MLVEHQDLSFDSNANVVESRARGVLIQALYSNPTPSMPDSSTLNLASDCIASDDNAFLHHEA